MAALRLDYSKYSLSRFGDALGSNAPYPGGGSAAALVGAAGCALAEMVARFNIARDQKKGLPDKNGSAAKRIQGLRRMRRRMESLVTLDAKAFMAVSAYPKDRRSGIAYQRVLKRGAGVPLEICETVCQALGSVACETSRTSRWLASDLVESGILLEAAFVSARLNVEVNLRHLSDRRFAVVAVARLERLERSVKKMARDLRKALSA